MPTVCEILSKFEKRFDSIDQRLAAIEVVDSTGQGSFSGSLWEVSGDQVAVWSVATNRPLDWNQGQWARLTAGKVEARGDAFEFKSSDTGARVVIDKDGILLEGSAKQIGTSDFAAGVRGWQIDGAGDAEFGNIVARGVIRTPVFLKEEVASIGGTFLVAASDVLSVDVTTPSGVGKGFDISCPHNYVYFTVGDIIRCKPDGFREFWARIVGKSGHGSQRWGTDRWGWTGGDVGASSILSVILMAGDVDTTFYKGEALVSYGTSSGQGLMQMTATLPYAPYLDVFTHTGSPWSTLTPRVRLGYLAGITDPTFGALSGYGIWTDNGYFTGTFATTKLVIDNDGFTLSDELDVAWETIITSGAVAAIESLITANPASTSTALYQGVRGKVISKAGNTQNIATMVGVLGTVSHYGTGLISNMYGGYSSAVLRTDGGDTTNLYGQHAGVVLEANSGDVNDTLYLFQGTLAWTGTSGSVLNCIGLYIPTLYGTNKYGIWQDGASDDNIFKGPLKSDGGFYINNHLFDETGISDGYIWVYNAGSSKWVVETNPPPGAHVFVSATHTVSGLTIGNVVRATGAATFAWAQLQHSDLGGVTSDLHHTEAHVLATTGPHTGTLPWADLNKSGSSLADLATKSATALTSGLLAVARLPLASQWEWTYAGDCIVLPNTRAIAARNAASAIVELFFLDGSNWTTLRSGGAGVVFSNAAKTANIFQIADDGTVIVGAGAGSGSIAVGTGEITVDDITLYGTPETLASGIIGQSGNINVKLFLDMSAGGTARWFTFVSQHHSTGTAGDRVGVYGAVESSSTGGAAVFGGNFLAQINSGAADGSVIGCEINVNNNSANLTGWSDPLNPIGLQIISGGSKTVKCALLITTNNPGTTDWLYGIRFNSNCVVDFGIDLANLTGAAHAMLLPNNVPLSIMDSDGVSVRRALLVDASDYTTLISAGAGFAFPNLAESVNLIKITNAGVVTVDNLKGNEGWYVRVHADGSLYTAVA